MYQFPPIIVSTDHASYNSESLLQPHTVVYTPDEARHNIPTKSKSEITEN